MAAGPSGATQLTSASSDRSEGEESSGRCRMAVSPPPFPVRLTRMPQLALTDLIMSESQLLSDFGFADALQR